MHFFVFYFQLAKIVLFTVTFCFRSNMHYSDVLLEKLSLFLYVRARARVCVCIY